MACYANFSIINMFVDVAPAVVNTCPPEFAPLLPDLTDGRLSASSSHANCPPQNGRLRSPGAWCAETGTNGDWIEAS